jgi:hypothetical protein
MFIYFILKSTYISVLTEQFRIWPGPGISKYHEHLENLPPVKTEACVRELLSSHHAGDQTVHIQCSVFLPRMDDFQNYYKKILTIS